MSIDSLRTNLDDVDREINNLLAQRFFICMQIAIEKKRYNIPVLNELAKEKRMLMYSKILGDYGVAIYETIHEQSVKLQNKI